MINLHKLAGAVAAHMARGIGLENDKIDRLRYGLEIILGALIKGAVLFFLAHLLNILPHVALALAAAGFFRLLSGGAHCSSYGRCLVLGVTVYLLTGLVAVSMAKFVTPPLLTGMAAIVILGAAACTFKWAPGEVPCRAMGGRREIMTFKFLSLLYLALWAALFLHLASRVNGSLLLASLLALTMQTLSFTPLGYGLVARADHFMAKLAGKGGETGAFAEEIAVHPRGFDGPGCGRHRD